MAIPSGRDWLGTSTRSGLVASFGLSSRIWPAWRRGGSAERPTSRTRIRGAWLDMLVIMVLLFSVV